MKLFKKRTGRERFARIAITGILCLCLAVTAAESDSAYAAGSLAYTSPFTNSGYNINSRFSGNLIVNGVDVSAWQSTSTDWKKAKNAGSDFAILRVTYTNYGPKTLKLNNDKNFQTLYNNAKKAGVMTGVYVFSQATTAIEAVNEADFAVRRLRALGIGPDDLQLPVYMDYEFAGGILGRMHGISRTSATNSAVAFCNRIKAYGYTPGIYANLSFCNSQLDLSRFAPDVDIWCAQYYSSCGLSKPYSKWQYSSSGSVSGISGKADVNFWFINKNSANNPLTSIKGSIPASFAEKSRFNIYDGETLLKEGRDYNVGEIRNNTVNQGNWFYIKGIGRYGGYALIPVKSTSGAEPAEGEVPDITDSCADYLTYASTAQSSYLYVKSTVKATKIKTLKKRKKGFYIKVAKKKKANASGYQVRYSRNKNMSGSVTKTIGSKYNKVSKTIKTGVRKKTFYVQVRTYKDAGGLRFYSGWSKVRKVKTK